MKLRWNNFNSGLALSSRVGAEGSYRYGVGVMIDNPPGFVYSGQQLTADTSIKVGGDDAVMQNGYVLSQSSSELALVNMNTGNTLISDTSTNMGVYAVATLTNTSSTPENEVYYAYAHNADATNQDIGKYDFASSSYNHSWWTDLTGVEITVNDECLYGKNQKLFAAEGAQIKIYDRVTNSTETSIDFPDTIRKFDELGNYLVVATDERIYLWNMNSVSWNYSIPIKGKFIDMASWKGGLYFVAKYSEGYYLNKIQGNYSTFQTLRKIPTTIELNNNQVGIPIVVNSFSLAGGDPIKMISSATGLWISINFYDNDKNQFHNLFFRYGSRYGAMEDIFTIEHYDTGKEGSNINLYTDSNLDNIYLLDRNNRLLYKVPTEGRGGDKAYFETTEKMTPQVENGISKGIAKKLYVYPAADSTATAVKVKLDGTEYTLNNSATFTANEPKVFSLNGRKFTNAAVRLEKKIPKIYRLELEFDYKKQV